MIFAFGETNDQIRSLIHLYINLRDFINYGGYPEIPLSSSVRCLSFVFSPENDYIEYYYFMLSMHLTNQ